MDNMKGISLLRGEPMEYPSESTLHELFAESASAYPNHIATVFEGRETTLGELNEMSDALARWLYHECDTRVGSIVGILMERCDEYVVAMLAALKAGAAFMPIGTWLCAYCFSLGIDGVRGVLMLIPTPSSM